MNIENSTSLQVAFSFLPKVCLFRTLFIYHTRCRNEIVTNDIEPSSRYHVLSDGRLMIDGTTSADQGRYGCMATNVAGEVVSSQAVLLLQQTTPSVGEYRLRYNVFHPVHGHIYLPICVYFIMFMVYYSLGTTTHIASYHYLVYLL